jgi:hypothetical protein
VMRQIVLALAGLSLVVAVASCGKQSDLQRPAPMWGAKAKADYAAQKRAEADKASNAAAANQAIAPQNPALQPYVNPGPVQATPIPGEQTLPGGGPDPGPQ